MTCSVVLPPLLQRAHVGARREGDAADLAGAVGVADRDVLVKKQACLVHGIEHAATRRQCEVVVGVRHAGDVAEHVGQQRAAVQHGAGEPDGQQDGRATNDDSQSERVVPKDFDRVRNGRLRAACAHKATRFVYHGLLDGAVVRVLAKVMPVERQVCRVFVEENRGLH